MVSEATQDKSVQVKMSPAWILQAESKVSGQLLFETHELGECGEVVRLEFIASFLRSVV